MTIDFSLKEIDSLTDKNFLSEGVGKVTWEIEVVFKCYVQKV